jgi:hypothetical protein
MRVGRIVVGFLLSTALGTGAIAADRSASCKTIVFREQLESLGGKLVMTKQADLVVFPQDFSTLCSGGGGFELVVRSDGSVMITGTEHMYFGGPEKSFEVGLRKAAKCEGILSNRIEKMRFMPPQLLGTLACVRFGVDWASDQPHELTKWRRKP